MLGNNTENGFLFNSFSPLRNLRPDSNKNGFVVAVVTAATVLLVVMLICCFSIISNCHTMNCLAVQNVSLMSFAFYSFWIFVDGWKSSRNLFWPILNYLINAAWLNNRKATFLKPTSLSVMDIKRQI